MTRRRAALRPSLTRRRGLAASLGVAVSVAAALATLDAGQTGSKPSLTLKVKPALAFSPAKVVVTAELKGGDDTSEELYCPDTWWEWGDGTESETKADCEPFEAGKSTIKRRWTIEHTYTTAGNYRIVLRLKRGSKVVVGGNTNLQIKPGVRDLSDPIQ